MPRTRAAALVTLAALAAAMVAGLVTRAPAQPEVGVSNGVPAKPAPTPPLVQWAGFTSKHEPGFFLIQGQADWQKLWFEHSGASPDLQYTQYRHIAPKIDFTRAMVVAYFRGPSVNADGEVATSIQDLPDQFLVRFEHSGFQNSGPGPRGGAVDTTPFGLWVIPLTEKPIVIQEIHRELKDEPSTFREVKRFPPRQP